MINIAHAVRRVKGDLPRMLEPHVEDALKLHGESSRRRRVLTPLATILLFVRQVLHGNTAITHLRHLSPLGFTAAAYCKARQRLSLELLEGVGRAVCRELRSAADDACRWRGHRVWRADGSSFSMPDTPALQGRFGQHGAQKPGCGFPTAHLLVPARRDSMRGRA